MKRVTLNLGPSFLVDDDVDVIDLQTKVGNHLEQFPGLESISFRRADVEEVRNGTCKVGPHPFTVDKMFPADKPVPDICRQHWYQGAMDDAHSEHQALFDEVRRLTGLVGHIEQTGGMTMTITIPLPEAATEGDQQGYPAFLGLKEGGDDEIGWYGSLRLYKHYEDFEGNEQDVVMAYDEPLPVAQWAAKLVEHYAAWRATRPLKCSNCGDAVAYDLSDHTWVGSDGEVNCPESDRPHGPVVADDVDTNETPTEG